MTAFIVSFIRSRPIFAGTAMTTLIVALIAAISAVFAGAAEAQGTNQMVQLLEYGQAATARQVAQQKQQTRFVARQVQQRFGSQGTNPSMPGLESEPFRQASLDAEKRTEITSAIARLAEASTSRDTLIRQYKTIVMRDPALCGSFQPGSLNMSSCLKYAQSIVLAQARAMQQPANHTGVEQSNRLGSARTSSTTSMTTDMAQKGRNDSSAVDSPDSELATAEDINRPRLIDTFPADMPSAPAVSPNLEEPDGAASRQQTSIESKPPLPLTLAPSVAVGNHVTNVVSEPARPPIPEARPTRDAHALGPVSDSLDPAKLNGDTIKLIGVVAVIAFVALLVLGATNRVVIFVNYWDLFATTAAFFAFPILALVGGMFTAPIYQYGFMAIGAVASLGLFAFSFWNAVKFNNVFIGAMIGVVKILCSLLGILVVVDALVLILGKTSDFRDTITGFVMLGALGKMARLLVNGERVTAAREERQAARLGNRASTDQKQDDSGAQGQNDAELLREQASIRKAALKANASDEDAHVAALIYGAVKRSSGSRDLAVKGARTYVQAKLRGNAKRNALRAAEIAAGVSFVSGLAS